MKLEKALIPPLCWALLTAAFAWAAFKAATASFTVDESFTYLHWVGAPFSNFTTFFEANNHPLNTLLCRVSVAIFGLSELSMRLPSLLSSILYFTAIYRIAMLAFGATAWTLLTVALACANPLVLDHFATARGYGMGIAFWTAGTWLILRAMSGRQSIGFGFLAGAFLGLSCCSYLTEVYAIVALTSAVQYSH